MSFGTGGRGVCGRRAGHRTLLPMRDSSDPGSSADEPEQTPALPAEQTGLAAAVARSRAIGLDGSLGRPEGPEDPSAFWRAPSTHVPEAPEDAGEQAARGEREGDRDARAAIIANAPVLDSIIVQTPEQVVLSAPADPEEGGARRAVSDTALTGPVPPLPDHIRVPEGVTLPPGVRLPQGITVFDGSLYSGSPLLEPEFAEGERPAEAEGPGEGLQARRSAQDPARQEHAPEPAPRNTESQEPESQEPEPDRDPALRTEQTLHDDEPRQEDAPRQQEPQSTALQDEAFGEPVCIP